MGAGALPGSCQGTRGAAFADGVRRSPSSTKARVERPKRDGIVAFRNEPTIARNVRPSLLPLDVGGRGAHAEQHHVLEVTLFQHLAGREDLAAQALPVARNAQLGLDLVGHFQTGPTPRRDKRSAEKCP